MNNSLDFKKKFSDSTIKNVDALDSNVEHQPCKDKMQSMHNLNKKRAKLHILTKYQYGVLNSYFEKDPLWEKDTVNAAAEELCISRTKILKWGSDKKRNIIKKMKNKPNAQENFCTKNVHMYVPNFDESLEQERNIKQTDSSVYKASSFNEDYNQKVKEIIEISKNPTNSKILKIIKQKKMECNEIEINQVDSRDKNDFHRNSDSNINITSLPNDCQNIITNENLEEQKNNEFLSVPCDSIYISNDKTTNWIENRKEVNRFNITNQNFSHGLNEMSQPVYSDFLFADNDYFKSINIINKFDIKSNFEEDCWFNNFGSMLNESDY